MRNPLMWKLLRKHISKAQLIGFAIANMVGLTIVLLGLQFWQDVRPVFEDEDSFIRKDYLVVTKSIGTASMVKRKRDCRPRAAAVDAQGGTVLDNKL